MKKLLKEEELFFLKEVIIQKGYLNKLEYNELRVKFNYGYESWKRELINNSLPFVSGQLTHLFEVFNIRYENNEVLYSDFLTLPKWRTEVFKNSKIKVKYNCEVCGKIKTSVLSKMLKRMYFSDKGICSSCINSKVRNTEEEIRLNSERQIKAQNRPEVKEKNRNSQIKRHKDPEVKKRYREIGKELWSKKEYRDNQVKKSIERWKDEEYAKKVLQNSKVGGLKGVYNKINYDSSYELAFIMKIEELGKEKLLSRANIKIGYKKKSGKCSSYFPDFFYDGKLIEVKGYAPWVDLENLNRKNLAAKNWCEKNNSYFRLVEFEDIRNWHKKALKWHHENK